MTNYSFQAVGPIFIITGSVTYNILNIGFTVIDMDVLDNEQLLLVKKGLQYNYLVSPDSVDVLAYIASNAIESGTTSPEQIADSIGAIIIGQNGAQVTYDDNGNQIVIEVPTLDDKVDKVAGYGLSQNDYTDEIADLVEVKTRVFNDTMSGAIGTGGDLTLTGGITFSVSAGYGYAKDPLDNTVLIEWTDPIIGSAAANGDNFIYVNYLGQIVQQSTRDSANHIYIGYIRTGFGNAQVVGYSPVKFTIKDYYFHLSQFITTGIGTIIEDGCNLSLQPNPDQLKVTLSSGMLWIDLTDKTIVDTSTFTKLFGSSDYGFIPDTVTTANTINNAYINVRTNDHLTALVPMTTGYYKKDLFFITPEGGLYYIYATEEYATEELAIAASIPQVPEQIKHSVARISSVVIQQGATSVVDIYDIRPMFSKLFQTGASNSPTTVIDHADLTGLGADTHLLYHTDARGDVRYHTKAQITALLLVKADVVHTHVISDVTGLQTALNGKEATITATTSADYYRGDKTFATLNKAAVGLPNADNTSDANKPVSTATQTALNGKSDTGHTHIIADVTGLQTALNGKESTVTAGTTAQYYRGDKTFQTLDKAAVGLTNVVDEDTTTTANITDSTNKRFVTNAQLVVIGNTSNTNTGDETTATIKTKLGVATTLVDGYLIATDWNTFNNKQALITAGTTGQYYRGDKTFQTLDKIAVGLANVDNTTDVNKPISTLTQTALNAKESTITAGTTGQYWRGDKSFQTLDKTVVGLSSVVDSDTTTTANITDSTNKRFVTDAQLVVIDSTSNTNTGDETQATIKTALGAATASVDGYMTLAAMAKLDGIADNANNYSHPNHSGDVVSTGDGATVIQPNVVGNSKLAQLPASTIKGNSTLSTGDVEDITLVKLNAMLNAGVWIKDEDFQQGNLTSAQGYVSVVSGAGSNILGTGVPGAVGVIYMTTGTSASGAATLHDVGGFPKHIAGVGELVLILKFKTNSLSTALQRFSLRLGFGDTTTTADNTDSAGYFEYTDTVNSGNWVYCTSANSVRTKVNSSVPVVALLNDNWTYLKVVCNAAGTQSDFYVNNVLLGSITTTIPTATGRSFDTSFNVTKSVGTTTPTIYIDRIYQHFIRSDVNSANWRL